MGDLARLARLVAPTSVAVVGASESMAISNNAVVPMLDGGRLVHLVNPKHATVYGRATVPSLTAIGEPVDAVLALVNAERAVAVIEEAGGLGCGGVVVVAAGFSELGDDGAALQDKLVTAARASGLAVVGPNCSGLKNVPLGVNLFTGGPLELRPGGIAVVSQSGFLTRSALAAARDRQLGISIAISSGNEAVCDLADHVQVLADDPTTSVICLVVETIRRADEFFSAVANARAAGKPVIAVKLGRSQRARDIIQSHTGAIADAGWVYDVAFREHGIVSAEGIDDLLDAAQLLGQLPRERRTSAERVGVITTSGGVAALATDLADEERVPIPRLEELEEWVRARVPGSTVNPLDLTGFVVTNRELAEELFARYADAVDVLVLCWWLGDGDEGWSKVLLEPFASAAASCDTPFVVTPLEATSIGDWVGAWRDRGLVFGRGLRSVYRGVRAMDQHVGQAVRAPQPAQSDRATPPPALVASDAGPIVGFEDAMALLSDVGVPIVPHTLLPAGPSGCTFEQMGPRLVVKLADVPHRAVIGAVEVDVVPSEVDAAAERLRTIARDHGVPDRVVVQPFVAGAGEAFAGLQCETDLGPVALLGAGGARVEVTREIAGRMLPIDERAALALVDEIARTPALHDLRDRCAWPTAAFVDVVLAIGELWRRHGSWLHSVDLNPLIVSADGVVAVDALLIARTNGSTP